MTFNGNDKILVYSTDWCSDCYRTKFFFDEYGIDYEEIDVDEDPMPDAFTIFKPTRFGKKMVLAGTDGTKPAKRALITHKIASLKRKGWYIEASHRMADILNSAGTNIVQDHDTVEKVLGKTVKWLNDDGKYERTDGGSIKATKQIFGFPKI